MGERGFSITPWELDTAGTLYRWEVHTPQANRSGTAGSWRTARRMVRKAVREIRRDARLVARLSESTSCAGSTAPPPVDSASRHEPTGLRSSPPAATSEMGRRDELLRHRPALAAALIEERDRLLADNERLREALRVVMAETGTSTLAHHAARDALTQGDADGE